LLVDEIGKPIADERMIVDDEYWTLARHSVG
jgi:hypothetical protein